jgi:hypothetical protein
MAASTMSLRNSIRFQKALALAAAASNEFEAAAAELAARRLMETCNIDPTRIPNGSLYSRMGFADNPLLKKLRSEWREQHPVAAPVVEQEEEERRSRTSLGFSWSSEKYVKANQKRTKRTLNIRNRSSKPRDEARVEKLRQLLNSKSRSAICAEDGFNMGEISGIIRDYLGSKSALWRYRNNPKWIETCEAGRTVYLLMTAVELATSGKTINQEIVDGASLAQSQQDAQPDCQRGEAGEAMPPGP